MMTTKQRCYAIFKSLYFGILPSFIYEKECHYKRNGEGVGVYSYYEHLKVNMLIVKCLILKTEHESTHNFHKMKVRRWIRWQD